MSATRTCSGRCKPLGSRADRAQYLSERVRGWFIRTVWIMWSFLCLDGPLGPFFGPSQGVGAPISDVGGLCLRAPPRPYSIQYLSERVGVWTIRAVWPLWSFCSIGRFYRITEIALLCQLCDILALCHAPISSARNSETETFPSLESPHSAVTFRKCPNSAPKTKKIRPTRFTLVLRCRPPNPNPE